jgi:uncharacterized protein YqhQ
MFQKESNAALSEQKGFGNLKIIKNAFANVDRDVIGVLVMILFPSFLTQIISQGAYGNCLLILPLSAYVGVVELLNPLKSRVSEDRV